MARIDLKDLRQVAMDETSARKRHDYISMFFDLASRRLIFACKGRSAWIPGQFTDFMRSHGGDRKGVRQASRDMSPAYIKGIGQHLPNASITFD